MPSANPPDDVTNLISRPLTLPQRKALLKQLQSTETISSLRRPEILLDFFTDSLSTPDLSLSVPALTGLFHLITTRNLDYPSFYPRLYALLDAKLLHSKYRSRVLRHLDTFLSPTNHLPATTIASFIKRLSRLCIFGPPAAIIAIVPFIYNLLKSHPSTTFLLHRQPHPPYTKSTTNLGTDPFDAAEADPQRTNAIDSSLWELHTLQSHYHPTVASICRIISEQFTKREYNLEDFLDHGYGTLLDGELKKGKKEPIGDEVVKRKRAEREVVVEWKIPKRVFKKEKGSAEVDVIGDLWDFS